MARQLIVELVGRSQQFNKSMDTATSKLQQTSQKMRSVGAKMTAAFTVPIVAGGAAVFQAASSMQESMSKVSTVFGDAGKDMLEWSKTTAKAMGLSRAESLEAAGSFGNMFDQLGIADAESAKMSKGIVQLAADFGSFNDLPTAAVIDSISSAFRGEYDSLQRVIPTINAAAVQTKALEMTGKANAKALTDQEKALAVNALLYDKAGAALGDFDRTSDSAANKQKMLTAQFKDASAELGLKLIPIGQQLIGWLTTATEKFNGLSPGVQTAILVAGGLLAVVGPLTAAVGALGGALAFVAANPVVLVIAGVAALAAGLVIAYQKSETFRNIVDGAFNAVKNGVRVMWDVVGPILGWFKDRLGEVANIAGKVVGPISKIAGAAGKLGGAVGGAIGRLPIFHDGGVVPGAPGQNVPIMAQAGETVIPAGRRGGDVHVHINAGTVIHERDLPRIVKDAVREAGLYGVG